MIEGGKAFGSGRSLGWIGLENQIDILVELW